ncbi:radical SAM protein, partial [Halobacteriovorax sp.]|uniref:radical SAM protein n=1 Tax=Halobacteriovorax sp. TaxID=2020862 RepID=UPI0035653869
TEYSIGNLKNNTFDEIWNGEIARRWSREFLEGNSKMCRSDIDYNNCNLCAGNNELLEHAELSEVQLSPVLKLTANFNGFCNLECQMCHVWKMPNGFYTEENFWKDARLSMFPHLKEIDMLSGEPFLQNDTFKLIDEVSAVNPECKWNITTNMHWKLTTKIKSYLDKIEVKSIVASIDSLIPEVYNKIRKLGNLSVVLKNIDAVLDYEQDRIKRGKSSLNINMNFLVQKDNWREVPDVLDFCKNKGILPFISLCYEPIEYSLLELEKNEKIRIVDFLLSMDAVKVSLSMRVIKPLIFSLPSIDRAYYLPIMNMKMNESYKEKLKL